jgi:hypothetical protein
MKQIDLTNISPINGKAEDSPRAILRMVLEQSPGRAFTIDEMRRRIRIMDTLDETKPANGGSDYFTLEDADHAMLKSAYDTFPWTRANAGLIAIADALDNAQTVSSTKREKSQALRDAFEDEHDGA